MSLRKSPERTPALLAALRRNAQKCTGPKTPRGKARSSLNALKHGRFARNLPGKILAAGVREVESVFKYRKQISRLFEGKSGRVLTERSANTMAIAILRENSVRRKPPLSPLLRKEGSRETRLAESDGYLREVRAALATGMPMITAEQLEEIKRQSSQSPGEKRDKEI